MKGTHAAMPHNRLPNLFIEYRLRCPQKSDNKMLHTGSVN